MGGMGGPVAGNNAILGMGAGALLGGALMSGSGGATGNSMLSGNTGIQPMPQSVYGGPPPFGAHTTPSNQQGRFARKVSLLI